LDAGLTCIVIGWRSNRMKEPSPSSNPSKILLFAVPRKFLHTSQIRRKSHIPGESSETPRPGRLFPSLFPLRGQNYSGIPCFAIFRNRWEWDRWDRPSRLAGVGFNDCWRRSVILEGQLALDCVWHRYHRCVRKGETVLRIPASVHALSALTRASALF